MTSRHLLFWARLCPRKIGAAIIAAGLVFSLAAVDARGQSFSLDDDPAAPIASAIGILPGLGAEDEFGITFPGGGFALAPSPSIVASIPVTGLGDGTIFSGTPGGLQFGPNGSYIDAFSTNHPSSTLSIGIDFSVDRVTVGPPGTAVGFEALGFQQPGDIFGSTAVFASPAAFVGTLPPGPPYVGPLPTAGSAPGGSNVLLIDESLLGLTVTGFPGALTPSGVPALPPIPASHDNVDAFDYALQVPFIGGPPGLGLYPVDSYFAIAPDEAAAVGASPADLFAVPAGAPGTPPAPYAVAPMLGLFPGSDSIDALVMFDVSITPSGGASFVEPGLDYALFSLAPGSASLAAFGLSADEVFFTDFTGVFATYVFPTDVGLFPGGMLPFSGDNIDALEITVVPEPCSIVLAVFGLVGLLVRRRRRC